MRFIKYTIHLQNQNLLFVNFGFRMNLNGSLITEARKLILTHTVLGISTPLKYQREERGESGRIFNGKFQKECIFFIYVYMFQIYFLVRNHLFAWHWLPEGC